MQEQIALANQTFGKELSNSTAQHPQLLESLQGLSGKVAILGGTFDPLHNGHLLIAEKMRSELGLDKVILLPTKQNPLKLNHPAADDQDRIDMLLAAVEDHPELLVCSAELNGEVPSFTIDMLREVSHIAADDLDLHFIIGADNLLDLQGWKEAQQIPLYAKLCVAARPGMELDPLFDGITGFLDAEDVAEIRQRTITTTDDPNSSSAIRKRRAAEQEIEDAVPAGVKQIIEERNLYKVEASNGNTLADTEAPSQVNGLGTSTEAIRRVAETSMEISRQLEQSRDSFKVAVSQRKFRATRFEYNFKMICADIDEAERQGVKRLVFPELTIPGYLSLDMFKNPAYIEENLKVLRKIVEYSAGKNVVIIVGFADRGPDRGNGEHDIYNAAAVIQNGKVLDTIHKVLLPEYDIHWERRYFTSGNGVRATDINGSKEGIFVCEDLWDETYEKRIAAELRRQGANRLFNLSASPFIDGKGATRHQLLQGKVQTLGVDLVYANLVGAQDGYEGEVIFDGRSMIFDRNGMLKGVGKPFGEELLVVDLHSPIALSLPQWHSIEEKHDALVMGIQDYFERFNLDKALIGISGGIDSALIAALACEALGPKRVRGLTMPMKGVTGNDTYSDAWLLAKNLGFDLKEVPIAKIFRAKEDALRSTYGASTGLKRNVIELGAKLKLWRAEADPISPLTKENLQSRTRGELLMADANNHPGDVVLCPGNETEFWNFTLYGDSVGAIKPLGNTDKLSIFALSHYINQHIGRAAIPEGILQRPPTAELMTGQLDLDVLPADYDVMSPLIRQALIPGRTRAEMLSMFRTQLGDRTEEVIDTTIRKIRGNKDGFGKEWAHRQTPPSFRLTEHAVGAGRRIPYDNQFGL